MRALSGGPKELIIITEHFSPSTGATAQLVADLADDLHRHGARLRVLTSTAGSADYPFPILRLSGPSSTSVGVLSKLIDGVWFSAGSALWLIVNIKKSQSLFIVSNPPFIGLIGILLSVVRRTRYIFLFQDIFPRSASLTGILPSQGPLIRLWRYLLKAVLTRSESTVVLSDAMVRRCRFEFGSETRLVSIPNWSVSSPSSKPKWQSPLTVQWDLENTFTVQYSGNFGRLHEILTILEAARLLQDEPVKFVFVGGGAKSTQIDRYRKAYDLNNVLIKPYQSRTLLTDSLAACDVSIVSLIPGAEDTVAPSKFYGIIASSRPVLLIAEESSDLASIIRRSQCGKVVPQGDVTLLSETILYLKENAQAVAEMGKNARALYDQKYSRSRSTSEYYRLLSQHDMV